VDALKLPLWRRLVRWFADHAPAARATGVAEIVLGSWMLAQAYRDLA
jgi:hypothetical protein